MKKNYVIAMVVLILIFAVLLVPKYLNKGDKHVKYDVLETSEIPEKIKDILPKYLTEERALSCRLNDEIYVLVTRGEKQTGGYKVELEGIMKTNMTKEGFDLIIYAKFEDPDINDIVSQGFTYPFVIAKTNLKQMPGNIELEVEYED